MNKKQKKCKNGAELEKALNRDLRLNIIILVIILGLCLICLIYGWFLPRIWSGIMTGIVSIPILLETACFYKESWRRKRMRNFIEIRSKSE